MIVESCCWRADNSAENDDNDKRDDRLAWCWHIRFGSGVQSAHSDSQAFRVRDKRHLDQLL